MKLIEMEFQEDLENALKVLREGGVILYPTDTIWGLGCDATSEEALKRLFNLKKRPSSKAMISLVDSLDSLKKWVATVPEKAISEIKNSERPVTIIYDNPRNISNLLYAEDGSSAFRVTNHDFSQSLCRMLGKPLVSTSANFSGCPSPAFFHEIDPKIIESADYACFSDRENIVGNKPSRILKIKDNGDLTVIRE